jgi:hypothetical protein
MIRTQVSLSQEEYQLVKLEAKRMGISLAEFFRRSLRQAIPRTKHKPWMKYAGMVQTGNPNSSQEIDDIVYGQKD